VSKVIDKNVFKDESIKFLKNLSEKPKSSLVEIKRLTKIDDKITSDLADERETFYRLLDSENKKIGVSAFFEKKKPEWKK
jgi:hypothetical protein